MTLNERIKNIPNEDNYLIAGYIKDNNVVMKVRAICESVKRDLSSSDVISAIQDASCDQRSFWNQYLVSDFAEAALDVLGIKKYEGERRQVLEMIEVKLDV